MLCRSVSCSFCLMPSNILLSPVNNHKTQNMTMCTIMTKEICNCNSMFLLNTNHYLKNSCSFSFSYTSMGSPIHYLTHFLPSQCCRGQLDHRKHTPLKMTEYIIISTLSTFNYNSHYLVLTMNYYYYYYNLLLLAFILLIIFYTTLYYCCLLLLLIIYCLLWRLSLGCCALLCVS